LRRKILYARRLPDDGMLLRGILTDFYFALHATSQRGQSLGAYQG